MSGVGTALWGPRLPGHFRRQLTGSRGLAEIPQGMVAQEGALQEHDQESSQEGLAQGGEMKGQRPRDKWLQKRRGLCLQRAQPTGLSLWRCRGQGCQVPSPTPCASEHEMVWWGHRS